MRNELNGRVEMQTRKAICGAVVSLGSAGMLAYQSSLAGSLGAGLAGLAGLGLLAHGVFQRWQTQNDVKNLEAAAQTLEAQAVTTQDGKVYDRRFATGGGFQESLEIRDAGSNEVLQRQIQVDQMAVTEDVKGGTVTLSSDGNQVSFAGTLTLPHSPSDKAIVSHDLRSPVGSYQRSLLELDSEGDHSLALSGQEYISESCADLSEGEAPSGGVLTFLDDCGEIRLNSPLNLRALAECKLKVATESVDPMEASLIEPPPPQLPFDKLLTPQSQAARLAELRAQACQRYLEAETLYAHMKAPASILEPHRAEMKELSESWQLLPKRPNLEQLSEPTTDQKAQVTDLQLQLLAARSLAVSVQEKAGLVRDGLYQAKGPQQAAKALLEDIKPEVDRVQALLKQLQKAE